MGKILLNNLPMKIGAVFFASLLWFHTVTEKHYEYNFDVTNTVIQLPQGLELGTESIPEVTVRLSGKGKSLLTCFEEDALALNLDLTGYSAGSFEYPVDASRILLPKSESLSVMEVIYPKFIRLEMVKES